MKYIIKLIGIAILLSIVNVSLGQNQNYLSFDGVNDYVKYADDATLGLMDGATDYTIEAWVYPIDGSVQEYDRVLDRYYSFNIQMYDQNNDGNVEDWYFKVINGSDGTKFYNTQGDETLTLDAWNHIAVICNSSDGTLKLYVNGVDVTNSGGYSNNNLRSSVSNDNLYIGSYGTSGSFLGGYVDEVRLKNIAEVPANLHCHTYDSEYTSDGNTAALFHFNEGTGTSTVNEASSSNASLNNSPAWTAWDANDNLLLANEWTGASSTTWNTAGNWEGGVPSATEDVLIPNVTNQPSIGSGTTQDCRNILIEASADITVTGTLNIAGDFTNNGSFTSTGTIKFNGSEEQQIAGGTYYDLDIDNSTAANCTFTDNAVVSGTLNIAGDVTIQSGKSLDCNGAITTTEDCKIYNNGTINIGSTFSQNGDYDATAGMVIFDGAAAQTIPADNYFDLEINNSSDVIIDGDISISGNLTISKGKITIDNSETIDCEKDVVIESDGEIENNGTIKYEDDLIIKGSGTYTDNGTTEFYNGLNINTIAGATYNNLIINNAVSTYQVAINGNVTVKETLTVTKGELVVGSGETLDCNGPVLIDVDGEIDNDGTLKIGSTFTINSGGNYYYNSGEIVFDGEDASQIIPAEAYNSITIDNSNGVSLGGNVNVNGTLTLTNGILNSTSTELLTVRSSDPVIGGSNTAYVSGPMAKYGSSDFIFPVGDDGKFARIGVSTLSGTETFTAEYHKDKPADNANYLTPLTKVSDNEYWDLTRSGSATASVTMYWEDSKWSGIGSFDDLRIAHWNGSNWEEQTGTYTNSGAVGLETSESGSITVTGVSSFSPFAPATTNNVSNTLPVELISFNAESYNAVVNLNWSTASELNNKGFEIQRSTDTKNWQNIAFVEGAGNSNEINDYAIIDNSPSLNNYYRLMQIDFDGKTEYSEIKYIAFLNNDNINIYPNPAYNTINLEGIDINQVQAVKVYNTLGAEQKIELFSKTINVSDLSSGYYYIHLIMNDGTTQSSKFMKN